MNTKRVTVRVVLTALLMLTMASVVSAEPAQASTRWSAYHARKYMEGRTITHNKVSVTITGWSKTTLHKRGTFWTPTLRVQDHRACQPRCPRLSWSDLNPFHWAWSKIWGKIWNGLFVACAKGVRDGVLGSAAATMATTMMMRGAVLKATPEGAAVVVVLSCLAGIEG